MFKAKAKTENRIMLMQAFNTPGSII